MYNKCLPVDNIKKHYSSFTAVSYGKVKNNNSPVKDEKKFSASVQRNRV